MSAARMNVEAPIARLFAERWSTRAFAGDKPVSAGDLAACLEAARWAPSCFGEEPWRFVVADRFSDADAWRRVLEALAPKNRLWARQAPVLVVACAEPAFAHNGKPNRWAEYDAGQAAMSLCLQAASSGLASHQMGGFDVEALRQALSIPAGIAIMSVTALGHPGDATELDEDFLPAEQNPRTRKPLAEIVHAGTWREPWRPPAHAGWEARYQETASDALPWYQADLDADIAAALDELNLAPGKLLDPGCGPGTQAVALAKRGFDVTAGDIAPSAVEAARRLAEREGVSIALQVDDALDSKLRGPFDIVVDRGIFHCFDDDADQRRYLATVKRLLKPQGILLLKCFHKQETGEMGPPGRYDEADIRRLFADGFELVAARNSHFDSAVMEYSPKALFCILSRKSDKG